MQFINVISNNCAGAELYTRLKIQFNNPFMWTCVFADDMINLITHFDNINWCKLSALFMDSQTAKSNNYIEYTELIPGLRIDNVFDIWFTHYKYDADVGTPIKNGPDVLYKKNWEYSTIKYLSRVKRMCNGKIRPCFLIIAYQRHGWDTNKVSKLLSIKSPYKICCITDTIDHYSSNSTTVIFEPNLHQPGKLGPGQIVEAHYDTLLQWIK